jgi:demethylspheroidene O-methyltransferase
MAWLDRYCSVRDRWLSNPRFQRWAAAFPLTRPTARKRARALFDVCAGFVYSQILFACVRLKIFELLAVEPQTASSIATSLKLPREATDRLLEAAVSLRLIERRMAGRFGLGALGAAMLGNPAVAAMVEHHSLLYDDLRDPVGLLRGARKDTALGRYWAYSGARTPNDLTQATTAPYTALMGTSNPLVAGEILDAYPLNRHRCLMDVGGGDGSFLMAAALRWSRLQLVLFDLPAVAQAAAERFEAGGMAARAHSVAGDFLNDALPNGADVISLVRVVHDHDDAAASRLLRAVYAALPPDGVLLLAEPMAGTPGAEPVSEAYFGFYLLAMGSGRPRSPQQLQRMLSEAGFKSSRLLRTHQPLQARLIVAHKQLPQRHVVKKH